MSVSYSQTPWEDFCINLLRFIRMPLRRDSLARSPSLSVLHSGPLFSRPLSSPPLSDSLSLSPSLPGSLSKDILVHLAGAHSPSGHRPAVLGHVRLAWVLPHFLIGL